MEENETSYLKQAVPVLPSMNLEITRSFYEEKLGFRNGYADDDYLIFAKDEIAIHFWRCEDEIIPQNSSCFIYAEGIEELYEECDALGIVHPNGHLELKPWGIRQFVIIDPDGNAITFGEDAES